MTPDLLEASPVRTAVVVIAVVRDPRLLAAVAATLHVTEDLRITLTPLPDLATAKLLSARTRFDALLVEDAVLDAADARPLLGELAGRLPTIAIGSTTARAAESAWVGARDHVSFDDRLSIALPAALRAAIAPPARRAASSRKVHGRTVGFVGVAGGVGTTSSLLNCAAALAREGRSVIAVELTSWTSAFAAQLRHVPTTSLADLLASPEDIPRRIQGYLTAMPWGVRVLFGARAPLTALDAPALDQVLHALAHRADVVLLDLPARLSETFRPLARHLDQVVLVDDPRLDRADLAGAAQERLRAWGVGKARMGLLQVASAGAAELAHTLGVADVGAVPAASAVLDDAAARGIPAVIANPESALARAYAGAARELLAIADHQRLKVALVNASEDAARVVSDLLDESDPVRFDVARATSLDGVLGEVARGAFHAVLLFSDGRPDDLERDLARLCGASEQTAVVVVSIASGDTALGHALAHGAQDVVELVRADTYWLARSLVSAIERQRQMHRLRAQHRELETCEVSHRRIIMQLLRDAQHDPRMV